MGKEKIHITKNRNEIEDISTNLKEIKRIMRQSELLYANKLDNRGNRQIPRKTQIGETASRKNKLSE